MFSKLTNKKLASNRALHNLWKIRTFLESLLFYLKTLILFLRILTNSSLLWFLGTVCKTVSKQSLSVDYRHLCLAHTHTDIGDHFVSHFDQSNTVVDRKCLNVSPSPRVLCYKSFNALCDITFGTHKLPNIRPYYWFVQYKYVLVPQIGHQIVICGTLDAKIRILAPCFPSLSPLLSVTVIWWFAASA